MIDDRYLLNATNRAMRRARLRRGVFARNIGEIVLLERDSGIAALLRAIVDETVFTNVQIPGARTAPPVIWSSVSKVFLKPVIETAVALCAVLFDLAVNLLFTAVQGLH